MSSLSEMLKKKNKDARRAEIVAAVTKRLYSAKKKVEMKSEPVDVVPEQEDNQDDLAEPDELKLCQRARARLQELSKKVIQAQRSRTRRFNNTETQTDFDAHVLRVKEVAVSTEEFNCSPSVFFTENRRLLFTQYAYGMKQEPAWSNLPIMKNNRLPDEDSFSDDSLDSTHVVSATEEKPSMWNVISISSGKQFKTKKFDENDQRLTDISTQTQACFSGDIAVKMSDMETDNFNICSNDMVSPRQVDMCGHEHTNQPEVVAKINQLSSCLHKDVQEQAHSCASTHDSLDMDTGTITEGTPLQLSDHHLYTITENTQKNGSNDVTSAEYESTSIKHTTVVVTEKSENNLSNTVSFPDTCSCRTLRSTCGSCPVPESYRSFPLPDLMTDPHILCFEACTMYTKHDHDRQQCEDKMSQTTPELYLHNTIKKGTCTLQKTTNQTINDNSSNRDVIKCNENIAILYWINRKICKHCKKLLTHLCNHNGSTKLLPAQNTKTEGTQYSVSHLPVEASTQTGVTPFPNVTLMYTTLLGTYPQLLQMFNPVLEPEDFTAIFFPDHTSNPIIMKPIHGNSSHPPNSVGVQTDKNTEQMSGNENGWCNMELQCYNNTQDSGMQSNVPAPQRGTGLPQFAHGQPASQQVTNTHETCSEGSHTTTVPNSNTSTSVPINLDNFSDDEDAPCLPYVTVTPTQITGATGYQHLADIKNLILGTDRNIFPHNTVEEDHPVKRTKNIKKKSVSWSDLSGCGALHTEMVFASDHNVYDSSQVQPNKITKNSLLNVISAETWRPTLNSRQTSSQPENQRENKELHRSWSSVDVKELRSRKIEGKLDLAAFLREASALVQSLSQATSLLEKGRQLNITNSIPCEEDEAIDTVHNELWMAADNASYTSQSPFIKEEGSYIGPSSLPLVMSSKENDNGTTMVRKNITKCQRTRMSRSKKCNINMHTELDQIHHNRGISNWFCDEHEMPHTSSLPDCSNLNTDDSDCYCSISTCPTRLSAPHLNAFNNNHSYERSFPICSSPSSPRAYRQHLVSIRKQIVRASMPVMFTNCK
ncbi:hypothetical protein B7P43_G16608 [Cryptotermes secundus]|uniref:Uncharacterized protein n=2 Tax=Cryptotermes secundus TaxID=105785 RepID=A0A2J7QCW0_9NEOP|nr:hypothetical protein B7P43_G16608 [Cryptotermes secundus]